MDSDVFELSESDSDISSVNGEEIWGDSDLDSSDEEETNADTVTNTLYGISLFLNLFNLCHRISERAMIALLRFLAVFFTYIAHICNNTVLLEIASLFPRSLYSIRKPFKSNVKFTKFVVCPKCCALYMLDNCITTESGSPESKRCEHVEFPNHPQVSRRSKCNTVLLKKVRVANKIKLVPRKTYIYQSIKSSLKEMATRPGFLGICEKWRDRSMSMSLGTLGDIYDGKIWKSLHHINGRPFLSVPNNLCLGLNIDWFNPFSETPYSAGAIYLTVFNLPRTERFKLENVILVGMIPGPKEPKNMNPFLTPFVNEMNELYAFKNPSAFLSVSTIRAVISCVMCDLPATRKVCGFSSYNALQGCSKCLKQFPTAYFGAKPDYSGYDCENWILRDITTHRSKAFEHKNGRTLTKQNEIQSSYGVNLH